MLLERDWIWRWLMDLPNLQELETAAGLVYRHMQSSPLLQWPLLNERCGCEVWLKHENHNPTGAFKVRGGLVYLNGLKEREPGCAGLVSATRGNHGQSLAFAAALHGVSAVVVVPEGNSEDKNRAMRALGAELIVHGADFDEAVPYAEQLARDRGLHKIPSFHRDLVNGVGTYALEMFRAQPDLDTVYVPVGLGSGICGVISARNALGLQTEIVGVVAAGADAYAQSFHKGEAIATSAANTIADGMAVRVPSAQALEIMYANVARVVTVADSEITSAMRLLFSATHNVAEGAGAAPLAALLQESANNSMPNKGAKVACVLSGGNVDRESYSRVLQGA